LRELGRLPNERRTPCRTPSRSPIKRTFLAPEEFRHVTVFHVDETSEAPVLLFRGALRPHTRVALDKAWELDAAPRAERLTILFARFELSVLAAHKALRERDPDQVRAIELVLPKRIVP
jgi:hypothetical protein